MSNIKFLPQIWKSFFNLIVSICYIGYLPKGGGSVAALAGILFYLAIHKNPLIYFGILILLIIFGIILGNLAESFFNRKDPSRFVIDDFSGMLVALSFVPPRPLFLISAFLVFRCCDIAKIYPIKRLEALKGGWGIMLDDVVAGLYANIFIRTIQNFLPKG